MANDFKSDGDKSTADTSSTSLSADASLKTDAKIESTATVQNTSDNGSEKSTGKRHILNIRVPKFGNVYFVTLRHMQNIRVLRTEFLAWQPFLGLW